MRFLLALLIIQVIAGKTSGQPGTDSLLQVLKMEIQQKQHYDQAKLQRIQVLKQRLSKVPADSFPAQYQVCSEIYAEYKDFKFDSAFVYAQKLLQIGHSTADMAMLDESRIKLGSIQLSGGLFKEAFETMDQIDPQRANDSIRLKYFTLRSRALKDLAVYTRNAFYSPANLSLSAAVLDSALLLTKAGSYHHYKQVAEKLALSGKNREAEEILRKLLTNQRYTDHQRAMIANDLSHLTGGDEEQRLVTQAAIYDIRTSTKQTLAIFTLGKMLFKAGDINNAGILLKEALDQAEFYGNVPRVREVTAILTQVDAQGLINSGNRKNQWLTVLILIAVIVLVTLGSLSWRVYTSLKRVREREALVQKRNQQLDQINKRLEEDAYIKEEYIGQFFSVMSGYLEKIGKIKLNTERKLKAKNYEELLQLAREIDMKAERENLFYTFDNIFLKLFPNFISAINSLLKPEDQIWPKENQLLNTPLRIFALMRLGINDTQTIANILETAVSTIYTYKNRIKSKALVPGNDFDQHIMHIKFAEIP